jgi:phospholipid/cholesterol/gamma-HCH transport system substrate-binding protein
MSDRSDRIKAGVFVLVSVTLLFASVALIAGLRLFKSTKTYYVLFSESVTGLESSSTVRYNGVPVGRVSDIGFAPEDFPKIRVTIEVQPDTPIRWSTRAMLKPQGITGIYYVDLSGGAPEEAILPEEATIRAGESLSVQVMETLSQFQQVVTKLNAMLDENRESVSHTVQQIEVAATSFSEALGKLDEALASTTDLASKLHESLSGTIRSADETILALRDLIKDADTQAVPGKVTGFLDEATGLAREVRGQVAAADLGGTLERVGELVNRMEDLTEEVASAVREVKTGVAENRGTVLRMTSDLREFAQNLKLASREVRREPSRLFFGRSYAGRQEEK